MADPLLEKFSRTPMHTRDKGRRLKSDWRPANFSIKLLSFIIIIINIIITAWLIFPTETWLAYELTYAMGALYRHTIQYYYRYYYYARMFIKKS